MRNGFSLPELIVTIAIAIVIALIIIPGLFFRRGEKDLQNTANHIASLLRESQARSFANVSELAWGVYFYGTSSVPYYQMFSETSTSSNRVYGERYNLPVTVGYISSTLALPSYIREIRFERLSGLRSTSTFGTSIGLYLKNDATDSALIEVATSGAVSF